MSTREVTTHTGMPPRDAGSDCETSSRPTPVRTVGPGSGVDWQAVHEVIQRTMTQLTEQVLANRPQTTWKSGRNATRAFPLLSYTVFHRSSADDEDPVIVGITVAPEGTTARISGDISGDESGRVYFDEGCDLRVASSQDEITRAVSLIAERLSGQVSIVLAALDDPDFSRS